MKTESQMGKFTGPAEVRLVRNLPGPIERVWEYLTDPQKRARWLAAGPMEPRVGGKATFFFRHKDFSPNETPPEEYADHHNNGHETNSQILRWEPPHVLSFTFGSDSESVVTFELSVQGKNVVMVLTHRATAGDVPYLSSFSAGWHTHLEQLEAVLQNAPQPPFLPMYAQLKASYETTLSTLNVS